MSKARNNSKKGGKRQKRLRSHGIDDDLPGEKKMKKNLDRFPPRLWHYGKSTFRVMRDLEIRMPDDK
jgi:hypothetical protein